MTGTEFFRRRQISEEPSPPVLNFDGVKLVEHQLVEGTDSLQQWLVCLWLIQIEKQGEKLSPPVELETSFEIEAAGFVGIEAVDFVEFELEIVE